MNSKVKDICYIGLFTTLIIICSWISIPFVIPFTLQTFGIFITLLCLGGKKGLCSIFIYILLGIIGLPVFSSFNGGIGYLLSLNGGYILGFGIASFVYLICEKLLMNNKFKDIISLSVMMVIIYIVGSLWFYFLYIKEVGKIPYLESLLSTVVPFILGDIIKIVLVLLTYKKIKNILKIC